MHDYAGPRGRRHIRRIGPASWRDDNSFDNIVALALIDFALALFALVLFALVLLALALFALALFALVDVALVLFAVLERLRGRPGWRPHAVLLATEQAVGLYARLKAQHVVD